MCSTARSEETQRGLVRPETGTTSLIMSLFFPPMMDFVICQLILLLVYFKRQQKKSPKLCLIMYVLNYTVRA